MSDRRCIFCRDLECVSLSVFLDEDLQNLCCHSPTTGKPSWFNYYHPQCLDICLGDTTPFKSKSSLCSMCHTKTIMNAPPDGIINRTAVIFECRSPDKTRPYDSMYITFCEPCWARQGGKVWIPRVTSEF